jgi:hypothetical protein
MAEIIEANKKLGLPPKPPLELIIHDIPDFPAGATFRREEIYDDGQ